MHEGTPSAPGMSAEGELARALRLEFAERLFDEALVVFLGHVPLQDLRCDRHGEIDGFVADLLDGSRRLERESGAPRS